MILKRGTKVKLAKDVREKRADVYLNTPYRFDTNLIYTVDEYEGPHQQVSNGEAVDCYRLSGGMVKPMDKNNVEFGINQIIIPRSALIIQEKPDNFIS